MHGCVALVSYICRMLTMPVILELEGIKLRGQLCLPGEGNASPYPAVCICHGIPAYAPTPGDGGYPHLAARICAQGFAVFTLNFRGTACA